MYNKWKYKKPIHINKSKYNLVDLIKVNEIIRQVESNNKNVTLKIVETPKTLIIEEV